MQEFCSRRAHNVHYQATGLSQRNLKKIRMRSQHLYSSLHHPSRSYWLSFIGEPKIAPRGTVGCCVGGSMATDIAHPTFLQRQVLPLTVLSCVICHYLHQLDSQKKHDGPGPPHSEGRAELCSGRAGRGLHIGYHSPDAERRLSV